MLTNNLIHCSCGVGQSADLPEFPDQEAEGRVLHAGCEIERADGKQQVSILFYPAVLHSSFIPE